jgi:hypothetical protein
MINVFLAGAQRIAEKAGQEPVCRGIECAREQQERVVFRRAHQGLQQWRNARGWGHADEIAERTLGNGFSESTYR